MMACESHHLNAAFQNWSSRSPPIYSLTFPGRGELDIVGICMSYSPAPGDVTTTDIEWPKWDYNAADRTVHIELRKNNSGNTEQLELGEKLYFMAHVYQGAPSPPNLTVRNV